MYLVCIGVYAGITIHTVFTPLHPRVNPLCTSPAPSVECGAKAATVAALQNQTKTDGCWFLYQLVNKRSDTDLVNTQSAPRGGARAIVC